jgi:hypothetical protein
VLVQLQLVEQQHLHAGCGAVWQTEHRCIAVHRPLIQLFLKRTAAYAGTAVSEVSRTCASEPSQLVPSVLSSSYTHTLPPHTSEASLTPNVS